jgi:hypothetical protein
MSWVTTQDHGSHIPLLNIGIRKDGTITMNAETLRLDIESAYTHVPGEIWDVLIMASRLEESEDRDMVVECEAKDKLPNLVFGLYSDCKDRHEDEETGEKMEVDELVVQLDQYVLPTKEGDCVLLVRNAESCDDGGIVLGWAAMRGRDVVLDSDEERVGFGK